MRKFLITAVLAGAFAVPGFAQVTFTNTREAVAYYEELVGTLVKQVRLMQDDNAKLSGSVYDLQQRVDALEKRIGGLVSENADLRKTVAAEADARSKQLDRIADRIQQAGAAAKVQAQTAAPESYDIYEVEAGATLTAVSKASGVSVEEIKRANNMSNDILRIGQKLKIPRK